MVGWCRNLLSSAWLKCSISPRSSGLKCARRRSVRSSSAARTWSNRSRNSFRTGTTTSPPYQAQKRSTSSLTMRSAAGMSPRRSAVARRRGRPLCILDLGMPRDVEPSVAQLENVFLYDIDDLQAVAAQAAAERRRDIPAAERIVSEEVERFWAWYGGLVVVPVLKEFRERLDQVRATELERALRRLAHLSPEDRGEIEHFSQTLLNKFLHQPTLALKEAAQAGRGYGLLEALKRLFGLERRDDP